MKVSLIYTVLATLALREVSAVAIPDPEPQPQAQKYKIADSELGPVYSTVDPNQPRDLGSDISKRSPEPQQKYKIADTELGPVYSTVNPNQRRDIDNDLSKRGEAYTPLTPEDAASYAKEKYASLSSVLGRTTLILLSLSSGLVASGGHDKRSGEPLEKRDWAACVSPRQSFCSMSFVMRVARE